MPEHYPVVMPVIELGFKTMQLNSAEKRLASKIQKM